MVDVKRLTAIKTGIKEIINGRYFAQEGFNPNYVITPNGRRLSRVRILAVVVQKYDSEKFSSITLDDGTSTIRAKVFNSNILRDLKKGDLIDVIGKIREYNGEIYLITEMVNVMDDVNWELLRELELRKQNLDWEQKRKDVFSLQTQTLDIGELQKVAISKGIQPEEVEDILMSETIENKEEDDGAIAKEQKEKILRLIDRYDEGGGCNYTTILQKSELAEDVVDSVVNELLTDGICFEPRPGRIKKL